VWVGECSFWYRPTRVVPDQRPLNGRCCCCKRSSVMPDLPNHRASPPLDWYQIILLGEQLAQGCYRKAEWIRVRCVKFWVASPTVQPLHHQATTHTTTRHKQARTRTHTHTHLSAFCTGLSGSADTRKVKPIWILLKQETVSGISISWAICKSASRSRQITLPAPHHSSFTGQMPFLPPNQQHQSTEGN